MNIFLIGYMASGKSTVGKLLANKLDFDFLDLDTYIQAKESMDVPTIFSKKGEIYFRKKETESLKEIIDDLDHTVVALGGGTPCYGNNMEILKSSKNSKSVYLKVSIIQLSKRLLGEKETRPLVSHLKSEQEMMEFIGKHLFERQFFYNQSNIVIDTDNISADEIVEKIVLTLF